MEVDYDYKRSCVFCSLNDSRKKFLLAQLARAYIISAINFTLPEDETTHYN